MGFVLGDRLHQVPQVREGYMIKITRMFGCDSLDPHKIMGGPACNALEMLARVS